LEELAQMDHSGTAKRKKQAPGGVDSWIHPFTVEAVERPLTPAQPQQDRKPGAWQVFAAPGHPLASSLPRLLAEAGGGGVVVCLPPQLDPSPAAHRPGQTALEEDCVKLLLRGASAVLMDRKNARFVLVQHGCGAGGFARSLHLEAPEIVTCLIDVPPEHPKAAEWIMAEIAAATDFTEARYDGAGRRFEQRLRLLPMTGGPTDQWPLTANDVLLVTGGGKGIAAECALALGKKTGARLALLGRSEPAADAELAANLERIAAAGIHYRYVAADVTDADAVRAAIAEAERELGPISALLHGAGANVPQLLSTLDENAFQRTLAPKIQGVRNVLAAIDPDRLRLFITFGSIIGRAGLQGESDYAVANEWLTHLTERFHKEHPQCRCLAVEWSVWSGVGMGQRLGRVDALLQLGITPIPPDRGVEILLRLLARPLPAVSVVVTGRFGELPTLKLNKAELPFLRFLEQPSVFYPGIELVVDAVLSPETDPYLDDHVYHGERLFPAVMGLEAMAQVAMALAGSSAPPSFEDVKLHRPVVVPRSRKLAIRLAALVRRPDEIEVVLRSEETGFQANHFQATCRFESAPAGGAALAEQTTSSSADPAKQGADFSSALTGPNRPAVELDPASDLYRDLLFHTGRFQRVQQYRLLRAKECVVQIEPDAEAIWFGQYLPQDRVLGDTGVRDAAIHAIQACIPHARLLPVAVRRIVIGKIPCLLRAVRARTELPRLLLHAREQSHDGDTFTYDLELRGEDGSVLEKWEGLILRKVEPLARQTPWTQALLGPYIERRLEELLADASLSIALERNGRIERPARSDETIHALGINSVVRRRPDGKPEVLDEETVSVAHAGDLTLAVSGLGPVGCDLEVVSSRPVQVWKELLGPERSRLAEVISSEASEDADTAATRVWVASECLKKAGAMVNAPLVITSVQKDGWVLLASGPLRIATHVTDIRGFHNRWAIGVLARSNG
jgi:enediyne polyketide synthase